MQTYPQQLTVEADAAGQRLDQYLAARLGDTSRARIQQLIAEKKIRVNQGDARPSLRLRGAERISILGPVAVPPLRATAEDIALDIVFEDPDLAIIDKPAGMMVHAGAGATESTRNRGTLVNALLHRFTQLSTLGDALRPGIVHRLDKDTSGLIIVAKNDEAHRRLASQFARREVKKTYIALAHGWMKQPKGIITTSISRDSVRRTRMTTRRSGGREAVTRYEVKQQLASRYGKFSLLEVRIDTGRTHQIRVHLSSLGHPVVGDALYGAPRELKAGHAETIALPRNFLHAASLELAHPRTRQPLSFTRELPAELKTFLNQITHP
ncbi:MAG TPA: RluA family pseudouridine synthase [Terriglobales bacterium]|nr:RluA family pseudouridine synthase [Terriglobales bacterium]HKE23880.1 RluA family pseudouridine synthase [Bryobacteraceae bacterium]